MRVFHIRNQGRERERKNIQSYYGNSRGSAERLFHPELRQKTNRGRKLSGDSSDFFNERLSEQQTRGGAVLLIASFSPTKV